MRRTIPISKFISELLKDDLDSGKKPQLEPYRKIIDNPNLLSEEENKLRQKLVKYNGAFGDSFEWYPNMSFYMEEINKDEFLELKWCPHPPKERDGIDIMSDDTRYLNKIMKYIKDNSQYSEPKVIEMIKEYFASSNLPSSNKKKLFLVEIGTNRSIHDGNHRTGAILKTLSKDINSPIFPITIYVASLNKKDQLL